MIEFSTIIYNLFVIILTCGLVAVVGFVAYVKIAVEGFNADCKCKTSLVGSVALVTGGNAGIGLETARELSRRGARVIIASRNTEKSQRAVEDIIRTTGNTNVEHRFLDLSKFSSVRKFADDFNRSVDKLHILVNNSGIGSGSELTEDGCNIVMQVNYLSGFLLTMLLLKKLVDSKPSRIVLVSSMANRLADLNPKDLAGIKIDSEFTQYANSKLCQILMARALAKRLPDNVTINALHPGIVKTEIFDNMPFVLRYIVKGLVGLVFKDAREGAQTSVHVCVAPRLVNTSGQYFANCRPAKASRLVKDDALVETVWCESLKITNIDSDSFPLKQYPQ